MESRYIKMIREGNWKGQIHFDLSLELQKKINDDQRKRFKKCQGHRDMIGEQGTHM